MNPVKKEFSTGGIVYKKQKGRSPVWLLVQHASHKKWCFPKGLIGDVVDGESGEQTALREVEEEGGVKAKIIAKVPEKVQYFYVLKGERIFKTVTFYLMEYLSGDPAKHDWEMMAAGWFTGRQAEKKLGFESERKVFKVAQRLLKEHKNQLRYSLDF